MPTLSWSTNTDWESATDRARVASHNIGDRSANDINLGVDPDHGPAGDAMHYWHFDESSTGSGAEEIINADNGTYQGSPTLGAAGAFGSTAMDLDGSNDYVTAGSPTGFGHQKSFTLLTFIDTDDEDLRWQTILHTGSDPGCVRIQVKDAKSKARITAQFYDSNSNVQGSTTFHYNEVTAQPRPVVFRYDNDTSANECEIAVWYDGTKETELEGVARPDSTGNVSVHIGRSKGGTRHWDGVLDDYVYWDRGLSDSEVDTVLRAFEDGYLVTDWKAANGRADSIDISASVGTNETVECEVHQDTSSDGTVDNSETVSVTDGTNNYALNNFDASSNGQYRLRFDLFADQPTAGPAVSSADLNVTSVSTASWDGGTDGVLVTDASGVIQTTT